MAKTMLAISLLMGAGACSSAPVQRVAPTTSTVPDPTTTTELPTTTTIVPVETTTTTEPPYDWGPVICPSEPHPAHHEPCQGTRARSAPTESYEAPSPQSRTTRPSSGNGRCGGDLPPCYVMEAESGGDPNAVNADGCGGRGCFGKWQFDPLTSQSLGYSRPMNEYDEATQDQAARDLMARDGCSQWSTC